MNSHLTLQMAQTMQADRLMDAERARQVSQLRSRTGRLASLRRRVIGVNLPVGGTPIGARGGAAVAR